MLRSACLELLSDRMLDISGGRTMYNYEMSNGSRILLSMPEKGLSKFESISYNEISSLYNWQNKTILIAEDEEANFQYLRTVLSKTNVRIIRAKNGKEAIESVRNEENINLILMDIKMPEVDGIEATKAIKSMNKEMVVIAQTAYAMEEDQYTYMNAGCDDFLAKPIKFDQLLQMISKYI